MPSRKGKPNVLQNIHTLRDVYVAYDKEVQRKSKYDLSRKDFMNIAHTLLRNMLDHILEDSGEVKLNHSLGTIRIRKIKTNYNRPKINWKESNAIGKKVYFLNMHTGGYYVRFYWTKWLKVKVLGKSPYCFRPHRKNTVKLSNYFSTGIKDYFE